MKKKPKILVFRLKEIIYTLIFLALGIFLIYLLVHMFSSDGENAPASADIYVPGVYSASLQLGTQEVDVEVTVDTDQIRAIQLVNLNNSVAAMYPLMEPTIKHLEEQILASQTLEQVVHEETQKYTSSALLGAIEEALEKAVK